MTKKSTSKRRKRRPLVARLDFTWSAQDEYRANSEGWNIYHASRDGIEVYEIERNDVNDPPHEKAPRFKWDEDAVAHVALKARLGSAFHARAIKIHRNWRRFWRREASLPEPTAPAAPPGPIEDWLDPVLALLASDRCSARDRNRCARAFETIHQVVTKLAREKNEKRACEMLTDYIVNELGDA